MSVDRDRVCRLCLSSHGELHPIFSSTSSDDDSSALASKIKDCVSIEIENNDELPTKVCQKCVNNVTNWYKFKSVCECAQKKLQALTSKDGSQLEEINIKSEPLSDENYDDGVVIDGSYPNNDQNATSSSKIQPEGPPILASLGLTPRSDKGVDSEEAEVDDEYEEEPLGDRESQLPNIPEVSITVMRPTGETLQSKQGIQQIASKDCLVCGREYRYSHNARRHELAAHKFDRYTHKILPKKSMQTRMAPKLRPNPFNPKARLLPNPIHHKMQLYPKHMSNKLLPHKHMPPKMMLNKHAYSNVPQNNLPYPLRIKALKDLQIKKKEPQILKTLLSSKPEVLVSEPEILTTEMDESGRASPETLISEPEIASFQVETVLTEPDLDPQMDEDDVDDNDTVNHHYDTVDMDSDKEIEIARQNDNESEHNEKEINEDHDDYDNQDNDDSQENKLDTVEPDQKIDEEEEQDAEVAQDSQNHESQNGHDDSNAVENEGQQEEDEMPPLELAPVVEINEGHATNEDEKNDETVEPADQTVEPSQDDEEEDGEPKEHDPDKPYVTKTQREFINKYRNIIQQINTKRCICCDKEHPRRKAVIQHLQKNGHKVPKHTCYNCIITFTHLGALLSHMRANICTDLWKVIYLENGITEDMIFDSSKEDKVPYKDIINARSYACKLCPTKFQLKRFITKHVADCHEDGQSQVHSACVHCRTRFKDRSLLKRHIRNGDCLIYIICDLCSEKFSSVLEFNNHAMVEHPASDFGQSVSMAVDRRPSDCPLCEAKLTTYQNLIKHMKTYHDEDKPHYCQNCDAKFEKSEDLDKHIYDEHSSIAMGTQSGSKDVDTTIVKEESEEYHYSCTECNAIFETVDAWTDHQVAEHNQVAHHCDQCEKKFLRPSELEEHKHSHLRVKLYPCSICAHSYSTPQKLSDHVQQMHPGARVNATPESDFFCDICIRSFKSRQAYSNHMRIHAKVPTTNRRFVNNGPYLPPQQIGKMPVMMPNVSQFKQNIGACNVPNAPYSCDICGKGFMHKKNIWKHKKVLHADILSEKRYDSEENTMHASTEDDEFNPDDSVPLLSTPQFDSFNFSNYANNIQANPPAVTPPVASFSCDICPKSFPQMSHLQGHKRMKHGIINPASSSGETSQRSACTICNITFSDKKSYFRHRKNVHKTVQSRACKICGIKLNSTLELYEHLKAAHARELLGYNANQSVGKYETKQEDEDEYEEELETTDNPEFNSRYTCETCGKEFSGLLALQNHQCLNQISNNQKFNCEICHKSYTSIAALKSHRGWHLRSPDGKAAANNTGLWMPHHKNPSKISKHEVLETQLAAVPQSTPITVAKRRLPPEVEVTVVNPNKKMRSDDANESDQASSSNNMDGRYCNICDKQFTKRAAYQRHMDEVHQPNSVFCPVCDKSFTRKSTLLVHMKKHYEGGEGSSSGMLDQDEQMHSCDTCGETYQSAVALRSHRASRHGLTDSGESEDDERGVPQQPAEFTCGQCGDGVATPRDLIAHRTMHVTPSKYYCNTCNVYFASSIDLVNHTQARHTDTTNSKTSFFPCAMCDRFYMNKKGLQRHIDMAH